MSTTIHTDQKVILSRRVLIIALITFVSIALATSIWMMTVQTIAPPGLRILDFLWRAFNWLGI